MKIHCKKIFSPLLAIFMLLTLSPVTPVRAEEAVAATNETTLATTEVITETDALAAAPAIDLTADCAILNYVDEEVFASGNHVLRLHDKETLSSYVFLNTDGTKTVYYLDEAVKFVDEDGAIQEKDVTLALSGTVYTTTRNDISLSIPKDPASGITLIWQGHAVRILPQGGTLSNTVLEGNSIRYTDYYGQGADLVYTPTLTGVKEDIVLESYTGQNTFTFMLNTGGLNLYSANGRYYLAESKTAMDRIELGDLVTFDTNGRFSVGIMTSQTVSAGNIYRLTLTVDEAFLTDSETVYPVSIDPELNISDNTHGTGAIEDVGIYSGTPNATANWKYMHVGYYDDTYEVGRILVRLTGLINDEDYQATEADEILTAKFYMMEATGKATANINLYAFKGNSNWTESGATWNNVGASNLGYLIDTVSHPRSNWGCYDIIDLIRGWKNGESSENAGLILCHSNETSATKGFYSSEYTSNTDYRPYVVVTYTASVSHPISDGTYYINNQQTGKYIRYATSTPIGQSGLIANIGTSIRWLITWTGEAYTIRLASSPTKYLAVPEDTTSSSLTTVTVSDGATVPERCLWTITPGAYGHFRLKSVYNERYVGSNNSALYTSTTTPQGSYYYYIWRFANVTSYQELTSGFDVSDITLDFGESITTTILRSPVGATWTERGDFEYNLISGDENCFDQSNFNFAATGIGTAIFRATHKVTGLSSTFIIDVNSMLIYRTRNREEVGFASNTSIIPVTAEDLLVADIDTQTIISNGTYIALDDLFSCTYPEIQIAMSERVTVLRNFCHSQIHYDGIFTPIIDDMINHFIAGTGEYYSNSALTEQVVEHERTIAYVNGMMDILLDYLSEYNGDISGLYYDEDLWVDIESRDTHPMVSEMNERREIDTNYNAPSYPFNNGVPGLTLCIDSLYGNKFEITSYSLVGNEYSGTLTFRFYDHFGLDTMDLSEEKMDIMAPGSIPAFRQWYIMQHWDDLDSEIQPMPYVTIIEFTVPFSGTVS